MENKQVLNLQDIAIILDILNVASSRNAFRVEEYSAVGNIFHKLSAIIQASGPELQSPDAQPLSEDQKK